VGIGYKRRELIDVDCSRGGGRRGRKGGERKGKRVLALDAF